MGSTGLVAGVEGWLWRSGGSEDGSGDWHGSGGRNDEKTGKHGGRGSSRH